MSKLITLSVISLASVVLLAQGFYYNPYSQGLIPGGHHTNGYHGIWEFLVFSKLLVVFCLLITADCQTPLYL